MSAGEEFPQLTGGTPTRKERQQMAAANSKSPASTPTRQQHAAPRSPASTPERRQPTQQHQQHQQQQHQQNQQNQQQRNSPRVSHSNSGNSAGNNSRAAAPQLDDFEQFFVGTASLIGDIDKRVLVVLREPGVPSGTKFYGVLRSFDQFSNLVLQDCIEREFVGTEYAEKRRGLFVVRGENVVFIAQLDSSKPEVDASLTQIEWSSLVEKRDKLLKPLSSERADPLADD